MRFLHLLVAGFVVTAACGGTSGNPLDDGGTTGDGNNQNGDGSTNDGQAAPDTGNGDGSAAQCPNEAGRYTVTLSGQGCGNTAGDVPECIQQQQCDISISFSSSGGSSLGIKSQSPLPIGQDGSFTNGSIQEGSANRSGCVGTWDQNASTLTITCGGANTSQSCVAVLTRTTGTCN